MWKISSPSSTMPCMTEEPPVSTTPEDSSSSNPDSRSTCCTSENSSSTRGSITSASVCRDIERGARSPMPGTSIMSFAFASWRSATPCRILMFSASGAGDRDHRRMADRAVREHGDVGRAAADVEQTDAEVLLVLRQHRARGSERLQDQVVHFEPAAPHAFDDVLRRRHRARDDVHLHFQADSRHADGLAHVLLAVDDEFLPQHVEDLLVGRDVEDRKST